MTTNGQECSKIGADILSRNGSAVDAAIAALLCESVASLHRYCNFLFFIFSVPRAEKCFSIRLIRRRFTNEIYRERNIFRFFKHGSGRRISYDDMGRKEQNGGFSGREGDRPAGSDAGHVRWQCPFSHVW